MAKATPKGSLGSPLHRRCCEREYDGHIVGIHSLACSPGSWIRRLSSIVAGLITDYSVTCDAIAMGTLTYFDNKTHPHAGVDLSSYFTAIQHLVDKRPEGG